MHAAAVEKGCSRGVDSRAEARLDVGFNHRFGFQGADISSIRTDLPVTGVSGSVSLACICVQICDIIQLGAYSCTRGGPRCRPP